jgi:hypothetical protein
MPNGLGEAVNDNPITAYLTWLAIHKQLIAATTKKVTSPEHPNDHSVN